MWGGDFAFVAPCWGGGVLPRRGGARREQRTLQERARQEAVTLTAERDATRKAWVEHMGEVGDLRFEVLSRDKQIRDLHAKINRGWLGDLTVTAIRLRAKGGEGRLWRETSP